MTALHTAYRHGLALTATRADGAVVFGGGAYGPHVISGDSSDERIALHWAGYCHGQPRPADPRRGSVVYVEGTSGLIGVRVVGRSPRGGLLAFGHRFKYHSPRYVRLLPYQKHHGGWGYRLAQTYSADDARWPRWLTAHDAETGRWAKTTPCFKRRMAEQWR